MLPPSWMSKNKQSLLRDSPWILAWLILRPKNGVMFLRNVGWFSADCTVGRTSLCHWWLIKVRRGKVRLFLCLINWTLNHEDVEGSGCVCPSILTHGTNSKLVVTFKPRPLPPRQWIWYPLDMKFRWVPEPIWTTLERRKLLTLSGLELLAICRLACIQSLYQWLCILKIVLFLIDQYCHVIEWL
jgi:hypothetical protein